MLISKISLKNNPDIQFIADFLSPYTQRAYLVGGSVRDLLLGLPIHDYDIEIYDIEPKKFDLLMQKLGAEGFGKSFFVYKFKNYDLALARTENKVSLGHQGFEVQICHDEKLGAKRRDFTFNALMINIFNDEFLDFYGGFEDLQNKILRHIDAKSFQEDSLRVLRAISFCARFGFDIAKESLELMRKMDIKDLSKDRINAELYKFFKAFDLALGFFYIQNLDLEYKLWGIRTDDNSFIKLLKEARSFVKDEGLFLYLYLNFFNLNQDYFLTQHKIKKDIARKVKQFFKKDIDDFSLLKIAYDMPLKDWLGLYTQERICRAKHLGVYTEKFKSKISSKEYINKGFCGKMLGLELQKAKEEEIHAYLKEIR